LAFTYRSYIFAKRNMYAFVELLFWPSVGAIQIGMLGAFLSLTPEMKAFLLTGAIISGVLQVCQIDVAYGLLFDAWSKSLKQTFVTPVEHYHYIIGSWIFGICRGLIVFFALGGFCVWVFGFVMPSPTVIAISLAGIFLSALVIGMSVIFVILYFGQRIVEIIWMITTIVMLICGVYYPVSMLPKALQFMASLIPITYFLEFFRMSYGFVPVFTHPLIKGFGLSGIYTVIMFIMLDLALKRARKTGMIIKLSE
jgi:ABC-2 type transport system permease protein